MIRAALVLSRVSEEPWQLKPLSCDWSEQLQLPQSYSTTTPSRSNEFYGVSPTIAI